MTMARRDRAAAAPAYEDPLVELGMRADEFRTRGEAAGADWCAFGRFDPGEADLRQADELEERILSIPATTVAGIMVKLRIAARSVRMDTVETELQPPYAREGRDIDQWAVISAAADAERLVRLAAGKG
jgi:hypothetical protein